MHFELFQSILLSFLCRFPRFAAARTKFQRNNVQSMTQGSTDQPTILYGFIQMNSCEQIHESLGE